MAPDSDVFGRALLDWAMGATSPEVLEREDGFTQVGAGPMSISQISKVATAERKSIRYLHGRVLDVGCELAGGSGAANRGVRSLVSTRRPPAKAALIRG